MVGWRKAKWTERERKESGSTLSRTTREMNWDYTAILGALLNIMSYKIMAKELNAKR